MIVLRLTGQRAIQSRQLQSGLHVDMGVLDDITMVSTASYIGIAFRLSRPGVPGAEPAVGPVPENILPESALRAAT